MKDDRRENRESAIETAAYAVLAERGYGGTSMLNVAKRAKASNETMYRWFGDKNGLFAALVQRNAQRSAERLRAAIEGSGEPLETLRAVAPVLLSMVLGERAVALNRAAAGDPTGGLGRIIAEGGRARIVPLLTSVIARASETGALPPGDPTERAELFVTLLIGDHQIRRVIGALPEPTERDVRARAEVSLSQFMTFCTAPVPST
ncbi:TetR/AcrR family transcriptional regulator [Salinarimonas chemoclinalis]|uniref:TetR/AcrR family transcriptional regulator n=1 Tax=Salinarimonas chemoclinalis TaxID=3241599 RepID=UPI0035565932